LFFQLESSEAKNKSLMVDLLDVSLKLNLSNHSKKQYEDTIKALRSKNIELNSDLE
jgi:hypothetical protein